MSINDRIEELDKLARYVPDQLRLHHGTDYMHSYIKRYIIDFYQKDSEEVAARALRWEQKNRKELHK
jgi:hypothetical protein